MGINGTPVIDLHAQTLFVIAYVNGTPPTYQLHALNLTDLSDKNLGSNPNPVTVAASHILTNGSTDTFNAKYQRQRPGLVEAGGTIFAAFGSFCDFAASVSRGWVLGWNASTLVPLLVNQLDDTQATSPRNYFLSSVWMSGYGLAATEYGTRVYFSTGNSDGVSYDGKTDIQESVVTLDGDLTKVLGVYTPSNWSAMDNGDVDLSAGGVIVLPTNPYLALAAGKDGRLFLLQLQRSGAMTLLGTQQLGGCWCGPSYFTGSDGIGRIVTSQGQTLSTWQLQLSPTPNLVLEGKAAVTTGQDPGFFTAVSSNGTNAGSAIIWAVGRPTSANPAIVNLYAFAGTASNGTYQQLFSSPAGSWPSTEANANIVPVVANGKVYVAAYKTLTIFGTP